MSKSPIVQILASRDGVSEVAVVASGDDDELALYRDLNPAIALINDVLRSVAKSEGTGRSGHDSQG